MTEKKENFMPHWYNEVWNNGKENIIDDMMHPKVVAHGLGAEPIIGVDTFKDFYRAFNKTFSKIHITVDQNLVAGNFITAICTVTAFHKATKKEIKFTGSSTAELKDGVMVRAWNFFDFLTLNLQTGNIKPEQLLDLSL